eukprot:CAMPEP_0172519954 /NCGR_PEP_ID=MMETSP1066-20121228/291720_1 /TAXON_ID=671091 /ORGANISM="Coscinodiscus wailesii, Strain CCMP2513" /LENGTH=311 /DNA_ID=CAMNT_0013302629 /DNA_START=111 /DNA_END=1046 /DNA_ORIENTATION=-
MSQKGKPQKIAVIGTTGKLGRETVLLLASRGIPTRCLLRHDIPDGTRASMKHSASAAEVAAFLSALEGVEMVRGDVTDASSIENLLEGCTAVLSLQGPQRRSQLMDLFRDASSQPNHAKQINYVGVENIINAVKKSSTCDRIVRLTGKGEDPWRIVAILINLLGGMAKAWNYEGETLLRQSNVDYTIIRPGMLVQSCPTGAVLSLRDNGSDLPTSPVRYTSISSLCVDVLNYDNTRKATLCAMNVPPNKGQTLYAPLLERVRPDTRKFPDDLMRKHRLAVGVGGGVLVVSFCIIGAGVGIAVKSVVDMLLK